MVKHIVKLMSVYTKYQKYQKLNILEVDFDPCFTMQSENSSKNEKIATSILDGKTDGKIDFFIKKYQKMKPYFSKLSVSCRRERNFGNPPPLLKIFKKSDREQFPPPNPLPGK